MSQALLAEQIKRLLPSENDKRIRQAILLAAGFGATAGRSAVRNLERSLEQPTGILNVGSLEFTSDTEAVLSDWAWKIDFVIVQSGEQILTVDEPDEEFPRIDYFHGSIEEVDDELVGVIYYTPGDLDSTGNSIFPNIPENHLILARVIRNPDGSNGTPETPSNEWQDAPFDGKLYGRQNQGWTEIQPGGGRDDDAVHYDADDGKSVEEKLQARKNLDLPQQGFINRSGANITLLSDGAVNYKMSSSHQIEIHGIESLYEGQEVTISSRNNNAISIVDQSTLVDPSNRFQTAIKINPLQAITFRSIRQNTDVNNRRWFPLNYFNNFSTGESGVSAILFTWENTSSQNGGTPNQVAYFRRGAITPNRASFEFVNDVNFLESIRLGSRSKGFNWALRRDEQRLHYLISVTTSGTINDQTLTDGIFNYRFTNATEITGFDNGEIGKIITVQNDSAGNLTIPDQNSGSIAANRYNGIGSADLVIPSKGKADLIYCTGNRWELHSKNF